MNEARKQADAVKAEAKKSADAVRWEANANAEKIIKEAGSNPIKKAAAEPAAKKIRDELIINTAKSNGKLAIYSQVLAAY